MTIPLDATLTTALGVAFHMAAGERLAAGGSAEAVAGAPSGARSLVQSPYYRWGMAYNAAVGMGIAVSAYALQPDWMWMYWLDASRLPIWVVLYVFLLYPAMFTFGFLLADEAKKLPARGRGRAFDRAAGFASLLHCGDLGPNLERGDDFRMGCGRLHAFDRRRVCDPAAHLGFVDRVCCCHCFSCLAA